MTQNDRIILDEILTQRRNQVAAGLPDDSFFELFTAEQILKKYDLSYEEIEGGLVGAGGDGGIDGIYVFVNDELVPEDPDYTHLRKNIEVRLVILQAKNSQSFKETPVERLLTISSDILDLAKDVDDLRTVYNPPLLENIGRFRAVVQQLAAKFPALEVSYFYASKGFMAHENVRRKADKVEDLVQGYFPQSRSEFHFYGASELLELARQQPQTVHLLTLAENPISSSGQIGFVCLVHLVDFFRFIGDEGGSQEDHL